VFREQFNQVRAGFAGWRSIAARPNAYGGLQSLQALLQGFSFPIRKIGIDPFVKITVMADLMLFAQHCFQPVLVFFRGPTGDEEGCLQSEVAQQF
jgi:hypothetical protein